jgi:hypothetical protein
MAHRTAKPLIANPSLTATTKPMDERPDPAEWEILIRPSALFHPRPISGYLPMLNIRTLETDDI